MREERRGGGEARKRVPAISKFCAHVLEVVIPHVLDGEDEDVLAVVRCVAHGGEEALRELFALLFDLGQVDYFRALGSGHSGGVLGLRM